MNAFLTIFGLFITVITVVMGIISNIGLILTIILAAVGLVGPLFAHLNREMDQQESRIEHEN